MRALQWGIMVCLSLVGVLSFTHRADGAGAPPANPKQATPSTPATPAPSATPESTGALLIVHSPSLESAARAWRDHRAAQGWLVQIGASHTSDPAALRSIIRSWAAAHADAPRAVLLLGSVPPRSNDAAKAESAPPTKADGVPTFHFVQRDRAIIDRRDSKFASDAPYQDLDDDGVPDLMLGRVPARSESEAQRLLEKIRVWEATPPGHGHRRVEIAAGEGRFGPYDALLELLTSSLLIESVPITFDLRASYAKASSPFCPPPSSVRSVVRDQALSGALLFNYVGHGHATGLDALWWHGGRERLLEVEDLTLPKDEAQNPAVTPGGVALMICCSVGWFDDPNRPSLAEAMLFHPLGPVALIAGSRPTHPYANAIVERDGVRLLLRDRVPLAGELELGIARSLTSNEPEELDLIAAPIASLQRWSLSLREMRRDHARLYNLLGDPTTRIVHPPASASMSLTLDQARRLRGTLVSDPPPGATAEVSLLSRRRAAPPGVIPASGPNDPNLESITARNWPRANEWVLWRTRVPLDGGCFEVDLPELGPRRPHTLVVSVTAPNREERHPFAAGSVSAAGHQPADQARADTGREALVALDWIDYEALIRSAAR